MRAALLACILPLAASAAEERACTLRLAWWDAPACNPPPVLALGTENARREFSPQVLNFGTEARNLGDVANLLVREVAKDPKTGKETVTWAPFASVSLPAEDDTVGVMLISDAAGKRGTGRAFALGTGRFPLGSIRLVNLTGRELLLGLDGRSVRVPAGSVATHPRIFAKPEVAEISVLAVVNGDTQPVFTTKSEFSGLFRLAVFIVEIPGGETPRFECRTVIDFPQPEPRPAPNGRSPNAAPGKTGGQPDTARTGNPAAAR